MDWIKIAKLAGKHGVRYSTNSELEAFLKEVAAISIDGKGALGGPDPTPEMTEAACSQHWDTWSKRFHDERTKEGMRKMMRKTLSAALSVQPAAAVVGEPRSLTYPRELTDDLRDILSRMMWNTGPIAHVLRAGGEPIKSRAEDEQAHVLHWLICLALEHGSEWRAQASERIAEIRSAFGGASHE